VNDRNDQLRKLPRMGCGCVLCRPKPPAPPTDRDRMRAELDRQGIPHNLNRSDS
jgi:hypothetical protein